MGRRKSISDTNPRAFSAQKTHNTPRDRGYESVEELLQECAADSVPPAICMDPSCDYMCEMGPDQDRGFSGACGTKTMKAALVLAGLIYEAAMREDTQRRTACIRDLNDALRMSFDPKLGKIVATAVVDALSADMKIMAIREIRTFNDFSEENDPRGEHDFGAFEVAEQRFFWNIDYYDPNLEFGSEDPADPTKTTRVLAIMLAEEY